MKKQLLALSTTLVLTAAALAGTKPEVTLDFNKESSVAFENGAALGPEGSGVSGKSGDRAYVAKGTIGSTDPQPGAIVQDMMFDDLDKMTLTFWYKADDALAQNASLLNFGGAYMIWDGKSGWTARLGGKTDKPFGSWVRIGEKGPVGPWSATGEWIFGAISWNSETKTATVYQGAKDGAATLQRAFANMPIEGNIGGGTVGMIGNTQQPKVNPPMPSDRPFSGSIDNVNVFRAELSESEIEAVRAAGVENKTP
ncbi:MAG: LamG-like jellyroll fold domain-containing protein [Chthoniobacterales bacterium]